MEVILVRHTSVDVEPGICYGASDVAVRDTFEKEAEVTKQNLAPYLPFDAVYASPLTRTRKLAAYCGYPNPHLDDRLREMDFGDWEMMKYDDITDPCLDEWYKDYMHLPTPNGESFVDVRKRVNAFLNELKATYANKKDARIAIFAHGGVLIAAGLYAGLFGETNAWDHLVEFGEIQRIEI